MVIKYYYINYQPHDLFKKRQGGKGYSTQIRLVLWKERRGVVVYVSGAVHVCTAISGRLSCATTPSHYWQIPFGWDPPPSISILFCIISPIQSSSSLFLVYLSSPTPFFHFQIITCTNGPPLPHHLPFTFLIQII